MNFCENKDFELPLLVTRGYVGYPNASVTLSVERDFTIDAINLSINDYENYCIIVSQKDLNKLEFAGLDDIYSVGIIAKVISSEKIQNGLRVKLVGVSRIKITSVRQEGTSYLANALLYPDTLGENFDEIGLITAVVKKLEGLGFEDLSRGGTQSISEQLSRGISSLELSYFLANIVYAEPKDKQALLETPTIAERYNKLLEIINKQTEMREIDKQIMQTVQKNTDKQQKEYILREKLKAIKKELGEDPTKDSSSTLEKLDSNPYPEEVKAKVKDELKRKEMMPQGSLEASLIQDYIDIVFSRHKCVNNMMHFPDSLTRGNLRNHLLILHNCCRPIGNQVRLNWKSNECTSEVEIFFLRRNSSIRHRHRLVYYQTENWSNR